MKNEEYEKLYVVVSLSVSEDDASCHVGGIFADKEIAKLFLKSMKLSVIRRANEWNGKYYFAEIVELPKYHEEEFAYFDSFDLQFRAMLGIRAKHLKNKGELENEK